MSLMSVPVQQNMWTSVLFHMRHVPEISAVSRHVCKKFTYILFYLKFLQYVRKEVNRKNSY